MKNIFLHEDAEAELIEAARYYEELSIGLGTAFLGDVDKAATGIRANPEACQLVGRLVRRKVLSRFPYNLFFVVETDRIRILAVAHHKRRPGYWRRR